jgi:hypothetical protein
MNQKKMLLLAVFQLGLFSFVPGQTVNITGTITDINSKKVAGVGVKLKNMGLRTVTDTAGYFAFIKSSAGEIRKTPAQAMPFFSGNFLNFTVAKSNDRVLIETFDCKGRCVRVALDRAMSAGTYKTLPFPAGFSSQIYICRVTIGNTVSRLIKTPYSGKSAGKGSGMYLSKQSAPAYRAREAAAVDTLMISRPGYAAQMLALDSYVGTFPVTLQWAVSVVLDMEAYQSIGWPMVVTVWDLSIAAATVSATVASTTYPTPLNLSLAKDTANPGSYSGNIGFTVSKVTTLGDTVRVKDNDTVKVSYIKGGNPAASAKAVWSALAPSVSPSVSIYLGLRLPININADDRNITDSAITIHLASHKDTVGINVVLHEVAGSPGLYSGVVYPSLTTSTPYKVIAVRPPIDTLTTIYQSPALSHPIVSSALEGTALLWKCNQVSIMPDSLGIGYHGTTSKMKITVENDHIVANSLNVTVKSKKDPAGITVPLAVSVDTSFIFSANVNFTLGASSATTKTISVAGSDTVTISYYDPIMVPPETDSVKVSWNP